MIKNITICRVYADFYDRLCITVYAYNISNKIVKSRSYIMINYYITDA